MLDSGDLTTKSALFIIH